MKNSNIADKPTYKQLINKETRGKYYDMYANLKFKQYNIKKIKKSIKKYTKKSTYHITVNYIVEVTYKIKNNREATYDYEDSVTFAERSYGLYTKRMIWNKVENYLNNHVSVHGSSSWRLKKILKWSIIPIKKRHMENIKMYGTKYMYKLLGDTNQLNKTPDECVIDYLDYELTNNGRFRITRKDLYREFGKNKGITTKQIIDFAKKSKKISVFALDPLFEVFNSYVGEDPRITLVFVVNNNHLYPVLDKELKKQASRTKHLILQDFKWSVDYEHYDYIRSKNEIDTCENKLVLIDEKNLKDIILQRINKYGLMIINIKFLNSCVTSFEDAYSGKIIESSVDYAIRKLACDTLYRKMLSIEEFKFKNNSWTDLATKVFNFKFGNIPNSCYNDITFKMFEDYPVAPYIRTLAECIEETDRSYGFDICKCYTKVLRDNKFPYAIFTAFDEPRQYA